MLAAASSEDVSDQTEESSLPSEFAENFQH